MWYDSYSPYGDADLFGDGAEGRQAAVTETHTVSALRTGCLTPLTQVEAQVTEGEDDTWITCRGEILYYYCVILHMLYYTGGGKDHTWIIIIFISIKVCTYVSGDVISVNQLNVSVSWMKHLY